MSQPVPYQPVLLRLLHGTIALLTLSALVSGFWVYNTYDKRWGRLGLPTIADIQGIHGTIALTFLILLPAFALYSFQVGDRRLLQDSSVGQLGQLGKPAGWVAWQRLVNTAMLLAATLAVVTGRMMKEEWLPAGDLQRPWYLAHLVGWTVMLGCLALHGLMAAKVGGLPLLRSMVQWQVRESDRPQSWLRDFQFPPSQRLLNVVELVVMGGIILAFLLPAFSL